MLHTVSCAQWLLHSVLFNYIALNELKFPYNRFCGKFVLCLFHTGHHVSYDPRICMNWSRFTSPVQRERGNHKADHPVKFLFPPSAMVVNCIPETIVNK